MKTLLKLLVLIGVSGGIVTLGYKPAKQYWEERNRVRWDTTAIVRGEITRYVNSTGSIRPVRSVSVGSFVSGPIVELNVDFNDEVKEGDVLATIDAAVVQADVDVMRRRWRRVEAEVERIEAQLQQATNNYQRGKRLHTQRKDSCRRERWTSLSLGEVAAAQLKVAKATILQATASLETSQANLNYCEITAPVDGVVIDRKIDPGQTLAAAVSNARVVRRCARLAREGARVCLGRRSGHRSDAEGASRIASGDVHRRRASRRSLSTARSSRFASAAWRIRTS